MGLDLTDNAMHVLASRYLAREDSRVVETPEQMFMRVARNVAESERLYGASESEVEGWAQEFHRLMASLDFLPNSPTLMNAGRGLQQLAACFVLPIEDSIKSIFESITNTAIIHQSGGGTGFSFSRLRPKGDVVRSTGGTASGPVSFMKVFNAATEVVKQGGKRRGANMGILRVDHPDIEEFITCKQKGRELANFNISVALTPAFLKALDEDGDYDLVNPRNGEVVKRLAARKVFDLIVDMAWKTGDPGIVFLDRLNQDNPTPALGEIESTNPCGEQPLLPYEACNLGSVNLGHMVTWESDEGCAVGGDGKSPRQPCIDWERLEKVVRLSVRFLDDVIDAGKYPLDQIDRMVKGNRKIGLGVMGFADMLIDLGIAYDSDQAVEVGESVMSFIQRVARDESCRLADVRGVFPNFPGSVYDRPGSGLKPRNATCTTVAPTGSLSVIANCSSGIEPLFAVAYVRHVLDTELVEVNPRFERMARAMGFYSAELMARVAEHGTVRDVPGVPPEVRRLFVTAHDIDPDYHVRIQAAFQKYTDNAVSKTVNLRADATREDVARVFRLARSLGCKGVTIYRDKSKETQVLTAGIEGREAGGTGRAEAPSAPAAASTFRGGAVARPRPKITHGTTEKVKVGCGSLYVSVNSDDVGVCEVFTNTGREGGCPSQSEATSRLVSIALRSGVEVDEILGQLKGIRCLACIRRKDVEVKSCPDAIGRAIERYLATHPARVSAVAAREAGAGPGQGPAEAGPGDADGGDRDEDVGPNHHIEKGDPMEASPGFVNSICPDCGAETRHEGGCVVCPSCGFSRCD